MDVRGLDVAVDDALGVRVVERGEDAVHHVELLVERLQELLVDGVPQVDALEQLHRHVEEAVLLPEVVHGHDVRVVEERRRLRLALEALQGLVAGVEPGGDRLQGHEAVEDRVPGLVDLAHRPAAELADDLVLADPLALHAVTAGHALHAGEAGQAW